MRRCGGFTLVESLIAAAVLAFAVAAIAQAVTAGHAQIDAARRELRAVSLAEAELEALLAEPYAELAAGTTTTTAGEQADDAGEPYPDEYQAFSSTVTVAAEAALGGAGLGASAAGRLVTVTVADGEQTWTLQRFILKP